MQKLTLKNRDTQSKTAIFPRRADCSGMRSAGGPTPAMCQAELGPALRRPAPLPCSSLPRSSAAQVMRMRDVSATTQRSRDSRLGLDQLRRRSGRSPASQRSTYRPSRPQSQGGSQPPWQQWSGVRRSSQPGHRGGGAAVYWSVPMLPSLLLASGPMEVHPCCTASDPARRGWDPAYP